MFVDNYYTTVSQSVSHPATHYKDNVDDEEETVLDNYYVDNNSNNNNYYNYDNDFLL